MKRIRIMLGAALVLLAPLAGAGPVNVNTAGAKQLIALPGIGKARAAALIDYRQSHAPFDSVAELQAVEGIGPATVKKLKGRVVVDAPAPGRR